MNDAYNSALAALAGSGIGALASVGTTWLTQRAIKIGANAWPKTALGSSRSLASSSIRPHGCLPTRSLTNWTIYQNWFHFMQQWASCGFTLPTQRAA